MHEAAKTPENPNPYDVFTARGALVEAAKHAYAASLLADHADKELQKGQADKTYPDELLDRAVRRASVAQGLSTYALALNAWARQP